MVHDTLYFDAKTDEHIDTRIGAEEVDAPAKKITYIRKDGLEKSGCEAFCLTPKSPFSPPPPHFPSFFDSNFL